jgi:VanZ family protein
MMNILRKIPAILIMAVLFTLSAMPGDTPFLHSINISDKMEHAIAYFALGLACCIWIPGKKWLKRPIFYGVIVFCVGTAFAISDELHQKYVPGRSCDLFDVLADCVGILLSIFAYYFVRSRKR